MVLGGKNKYPEAWFCSALRDSYLSTTGICNPE